MREAVGPHGELQDYIPRIGDPDPHAAHKRPGAAQRWGERRLLSTARAFKAMPRATFVETGDLGRAYPINLQFRFALPDANGNALLPFSPLFPFLGGPENLAITIRRGLDPNATVTVDEVTLQSLGSNVGDVFPIDVVTARSLGIDVEMRGGGGNEAVWVEAIATEVTHVADRNTLPGWPRATQLGAGGFLAAIASPGSIQLLRPHAQRVQFFVVNTSTNADMILCFGDDNDASWAGPVGTVVLPKNTFARYESPVGGFRGRVTASWNNGAPDGGALVTEGTFF